MRYGPPGSKQLVYFVDDMNMPFVDKYDTQSAIELMRQSIDNKGWFDKVRSSCAKQQVLLLYIRRAASFSRVSGTSSVDVHCKEIARDLTRGRPCGGRVDPAPQTYTLSCPSNNNPEPIPNLLSLISDTKGMLKPGNRLPMDYPAMHNMHALPETECVRAVRTCAEQVKILMKEVNNTQYVACMNPTAGSFYITPRMQRHFVTIAVPMPPANIVRCFSSPLLRRQHSMSCP